jgi:hypothetical protein
MRIIPEHHLDYFSPLHLQYLLFDLLELIQMSSVSQARQTFVVASSR